MYIMFQNTVLFPISIPFYNVLRILRPTPLDFPQTKTDTVAFIIVRKHIYCLLVTILSVCLLADGLLMVTGDAARINGNERRSLTYDQFQAFRHNKEADRQSRFAPRKQKQKRQQPVSVSFLLLTILVSLVYVSVSP
jgi:hypothetical protein